MRVRACLPAGRLHTHDNTGGLHLDDAETGTVYSWDLCLAVKLHEGRRDVLGEVRSYLDRFSGMPPA